MSYRGRVKHLSRHMSKGAVPARGTLASWLADHLRPFPTPHLLFRVWIVGATQRQNVTVRDIATVAPEAHAAEEGQMTSPKCAGGVAILSPRDHRCSSRRAVELNTLHASSSFSSAHVSQTWARLSTPPWVKPLMTTHARPSSSTGRALLRRWCPAKGKFKPGPCRARKLRDELSLPRS